MEMSTFVLSLVLLISLIANGLLTYGIIHFKRSSKVQRQETYDAVALMQDLTRGKALVKIERVDPLDVMLLSPRDRN